MIHVLQLSVINEFVAVHGTQCDSLGRCTLAMADSGWVQLEFSSIGCDAV